MRRQTPEVSKYTHISTILKFLDNAARVYFNQIRCQCFSDIISNHQNDLRGFRTKIRPPPIMVGSTEQATLCVSLIVNSCGIMADFRGNHKDVRVKT